MSLPSEGRVLLVGGESAFQGWVKLALRDSEFQIVGEAAGVEETARLAAELALRPVKGDCHVIVVATKNNRLSIFCGDRNWLLWTGARPIRRTMAAFGKN